MIAVAYLVWAPLGIGPLHEFLSSYQRHPAGVEHELVIILNGMARGGFEPPAGERPGSGALSREQLSGELAGTAHRLLELERPMLDLAAYGAAARSLEHEQVCFLNSYSLILADGWLAHLSAAARLPGVGLVGATGSWESKAEFVREEGGLEHWLYQLVKLRQRRAEYPRFPNPHIRTTCFMLARELALQLGLEQARDKSASYLLESGINGITRQVCARGLRALVVGRDGRAFETEEWPASGTYRSDAQRNLLVSDNRTREWERASAQRRGRLARRTWGSPRSRGAARARARVGRAAAL